MGWRLGEQGSAGSAALNTSFSPPLVVSGHSDAIATSSLCGLRCDPDKRRSDGLRLIDPRLESGRTRSSAPRLSIARILCSRYADSSKPSPLILIKPTVLLESRNWSVPTETVITASILHLQEMERSNGNGHGAFSCPFTLR